MKIKLLLFISLFILFSNFSSGKELTIGIQAGYGSYSMATLKAYNTIVGKDNYIDEFPMTPFLQLEVDLDVFRDISFGLHYAKYSTGSRVLIHKFKEMETLKYDQIVNGQSLSFLLEIGRYEMSVADYDFAKSTSTSNFYFRYFFEFGMMWSEIKILDHNDNKRVSEGQDYFLMPGVAFSYRLGAFEFPLKIGYYVQTRDSFSAIWDGVRLSLGGSYNIEL
jgi:hypothetical protein